MRIVLALLSLCMSAYAAEERPADFASAAPIRLEGAGPHFRVWLSKSVYGAAAQRNVEDLRVVNAEGEFVPFAFAPREAEVAAPEKHALRLFPLFGDASRTAVDGLSLRVERSAAGTVVKVDSVDAPHGKPRKILGYLAEVPDLPRPLRALILDWEAKEGFSGTIRVEASADLKDWKPHARGPVIQLEHAGERLERKRVEVRWPQPQYLRISFAGVPADFVLKAITGELLPERRDPSRDLHAFDGMRNAEMKNEYQFDTGGGLPVDRITFKFPQPNTIAPVQVLTRERPEHSWRLLVAATVYRLAGDGSEIVSPDIAVAPTSARYWLLRVDPRSGGLGNGDVRLHVAWAPHQIVFAARGAAPFALLVGNKAASSAALPLATILPGYPERASVPTSGAPVGEARANAFAASRAENLVASAREFAGSEDGKKWILWTVLIAGVLLLVWMAMRLMRDLARSPDPPKRD